MRWKIFFYRSVSVLCLAFFLPSITLAGTLNLNITNGTDIRCDGQNGRCDSNTLTWQQAHDKSAPQNGSWNNQDALWSGVASGRAIVDRGGFSFDGSTLSGDTVTAADLFVWSDNAGTNCDVGVVGFTPGNFASYALSDFSQFGATRFATDMAAATFSGSAGYKDFSLNASGIAAISTVGSFGIGLRCASDIDNADPGSTVAYNSAEFLTGDAHPAYIAVTYTTGGGGGGGGGATTTTATTTVATDSQVQVVLLMIIAFGGMIALVRWYLYPQFQK